MPDHFDVFDRYGGKIGEVREGTDWSGTLASGAVMIGIFLAIGVFIVAWWLLVRIFRLWMRYPVVMSTIVIGSLGVFGIAYLVDDHQRAVAAQEREAAAWARAEAARIPELRFVPETDQGIGFNEPVDEDVYPLIELSSGKHIAEGGRPVYVNGQGERVFLTLKPAEGAVLVVSHTEGQGAYVRATPRLDDKLRAWPEGTWLEATGQTAQSESHNWVEVRDPGGSVGWIPQDYLEAP